MNVMGVGQRLMLFEVYRWISNRYLEDMVQLMGDVLNLISLKDAQTREVFKSVFSPVHLVIDPNSGEFNNALNLERDQVLGFNALIDI